MVIKIRAGRPRFGCRQGQEVFLFPTASRPALEPTQPPIQCVPGPTSPGGGGKRPWSEADHLPQIALMLRIRGAIYPLPHTRSWRGALCFEMGGKCNTNTKHETLCMGLV
jgi:hypothetical protein